MSHGTTTQRAAALGALLIGSALAAGCAATPHVYRPATPQAGVSALPFNVAVRPFQNGTEDFESRGGPFGDSDFLYNITRTGIPFLYEPVTPALWAKDFAAELAASGRFRAVHFAFDVSELADEDCVVEGTVVKAYVAGKKPTESQYELALHAVRPKDGRTVWERTVTRSGKIVDDEGGYPDCKASMDCVRRLYHADLNRVMQGLFADAGADLARALAGPAPPAARQKGGPGDAATSPADSVDETIERIMEGK